MTGYCKPAKNRRLPQIVYYKRNQPMEAKTDLRVLKTRRAIQSAFLELIEEKPVNKITVTELAARAEISKGTFYLHYLDIFHLYGQLVEQTAEKIAGSFDPYPALFQDPEAFVRTFMFAQVEPMGEALSRGERALLYERNIQFCSGYPQCFLEAFQAQIYRVGKLTPCVENDMKLHFLLTGILSLIVRYRPLAAGDQDRMQFMVEFLSNVIRQTFPEFYPGGAPN